MTKSEYVLILNGKEIALTVAGNLSSRSIDCIRPLDFHLVVRINKQVQDGFLVVGQLGEMDPDKVFMGSPIILDMADMP